MSAAALSHEIDVERETPTPTLVLLRTQEETHAAGGPPKAHDASRSELWRTKLRHDDVLKDQVTDRPSPVEPIDRAMTAMDVRAALARLRPEHRQVIVEMFYLGRSVTEIAQLLNIPEGTVTSRSYCGLRQLRRLLSAASCEPPCER